jgi:hypothetical protein
MAARPWTEALLVESLVSQRLLQKEGQGFVWRANSPALWYALADRASCQCLTKYAAIRGTV